MRDGSGVGVTWGRKDVVGVTWRRKDVVGGKKVDVVGKGLCKVASGLESGRDGVIPMTAAVVDE